MHWALIIVVYTAFSSKESNAIAVLDRFPDYATCRAAAEQAKKDLDPTGEPDVRTSCVRVDK